MCSRKTSYIYVSTKQATSKVKRQRDAMTVLLEDVVVGWLHADENRLAGIRAESSKALFVVDKNGPQCADAVSWLMKR